MVMNWKRIDMLAVVEFYAEEFDMIANEEELSKRFDEEIASFVIEKYGEDDTVAMNEAFNDWTDGLCKDGEIHEEQYNNYCYVGKYADD